MNGIVALQKKIQGDALLLPYCEDTEETAIYE
jgi:hypothetical protein